MDVPRLQPVAIALMLIWRVSMTCPFQIKTKHKNQRQSTHTTLNIKCERLHYTKVCIVFKRGEYSFTVYIYKYVSVRFTKENSERNILNKRSNGVSVHLVPDLHNVRHERSFSLVLFPPPPPFF